MLGRKKEPIPQEPSLQVDREVMKKLQRGEIKAVLKPDGSIEEMPLNKPEPIPAMPPEPEEPEEIQGEKPVIASPIPPVTPTQTEPVMQEKAVEKPPETETVSSVVNVLKAEIAHYTEAQKNYWAGYQDGFIKALDSISKKAEE